MIFFHKYYLCNLINNTTNNIINNKNFTLLCISCFLLGIKSSDIYIRINDILHYIYQDNILINNNNKESDKNIIFYYEYEVLESLGFDIASYHIRQKYISDLVETINNKIQYEKDENKTKKIKEYIIAYIKYCFILPVFLKFNPQTIVLSCINIIFKKLLNNFDIGQIIDLKRENVKHSDIDNFCELQNFFLEPKKTNDNNINDKIEINYNKVINMDIIKKINLSNADTVQYSPSNNYIENKNK